MESQIDLYRHYESALVVEFRKRGRDDKEKPQVRALAYAKENGNLPVFGKHVAEKNFHFVVTGWNHFLHMFQSMSSEERVFNEIIKYGEPFNFYADLELYRNVNPEITPGSDKEKALVEESKKAVTEAIVRCFPHLNASEFKLTDLDASDKSKFSRHFVVRIPGKALKDWKTALAIYDDLASNTPPESILWVFNVFACS